jgi:hypothetical protein
MGSMGNIGCGRQGIGLRSFSTPWFSIPVFLTEDFVAEACHVALTRGQRMLGQEFCDAMKRGALASQFCNQLFSGH